MNRTKLFDSSKCFLANRDNFCPYEQGLVFLIGTFYMLAGHDSFFSGFPHCLYFARNTINIKWQMTCYNLISRLPFTTTSFDLNGVLQHSYMHSILDSSQNKRPAPALYVTWLVTSYRYCSFHRNKY